VDIRCFIAINLPSEWKGRLAELETRLKEARADVSWVKPENVHLTLKFLGGVEETRIPLVKKALQKGLQGQKPLTLSLAGLGVFPNPRYPRVVWVGMEGDTERLQKLQGIVEQAMAELGFPREARSFSPHITLGRMRSQQNAISLMDLLRRLGDYRLDSVEAKSVELMRSQLHPEGAVYTVLERFPLGAPPVEAD
jgi:RNA 2',3'-cyclic 3'-phosphodiesterase